MRKAGIIFGVIVILILVLLTSGRVCRAAVTGGTSTANAPQITSSGTEILVSGTQVYFKIIPSTTGIYTITTSPASVDTEAIIYYYDGADLKGQQAQVADYDYNNGQYQFVLTYNLTESKAYYLYIHEYSYATATCTLIITGGGLQGTNHASAISITNPTTELRYKDAQTISISGTVNDPDGDNVTVSAVISGKKASTTVSGGNGNWILTWNTAGIIENTYTGIVFTADDGLGATSSATYTGNIVVDKTSPTANALSPADNAAQVGANANLVITFTESIAIGTGNITLKNSAGNTVETIDVTDSTKVTGSGSNTITIDPAITWNGDYYVLIDATAFKDLAGNSYAGINNSTDWNFTTANVTAPVVISLSPADNAINVGVNDNLVLTFNKNVVAGTGNITIMASSGTVETIVVTGTKVTGGGTNKITVDPAATLAGETGYYVLIDATAFKDNEGNYYAGISSGTDWNFTTIETTAPTVNSFSPADNAIGVGIFDKLVINFSEVVRIGTGNIIIKKVSDDNAVETIDVTDSTKVTGDGTSTITIDPVTSLDSETSYYVLIDAAAFKDTAGNNYAGISTPGGWNFTTADVTSPSIIDLSPQDNATSVGVNDVLIIRFTENVTVGTGNITIKKSQDNKTVETIAAASYKVKGSGTDTITIDPATTLAENTQYYVLIDATAFTDKAGNRFTGITSVTNWNFATTAVPVVSGLTPADGAVDVGVNSKLVIAFSEKVIMGSGNITIMTSGGSTVATITVTDTTKVSGSGTDRITINLATTLAGGTGYYVLIDAGAFKDTAGNSFPGISSPTAWNFTTVDSSFPTVNFIRPWNNAKLNINTGTTVIAELIYSASGTTIKKDSILIQIDGGARVKPTALVDIINGYKLYHVITGVNYGTNDNSHTITIWFTNSLDVENSQSVTFFMEPKRNGFGFGRLRFD
jgi:methionine-rich copper-binding protein CopC